ncbi:hypothetical protein R1sor_013911 [Riccia sorocarpa]|uniref:Uncharacterized protein n=1 Tax=Riccia sorocarpa TaxID=122646 RepID=A0ABD3H7Y2_9MARC
MRKHLFQIRTKHRLTLEARGLDEVDEPEEEDEDEKEKDDEREAFLSMAPSSVSWRSRPILRNVKGIIMATPATKKLVPPFTEETALAKVKAAEEAWNSRDPVRVSMAYTEDCEWRNRSEFFKGREAIREFLTRKWQSEHEYRLMKELWSYTGNRISVRFEYEWHDSAGQWYRTHGNEQWEFDDDGLMRRRDMSANDVPIKHEHRRYFAPSS